MRDDRCCHLLTPGLRFFRFGTIMDTAGDNTELSGLGGYRGMAEKVKEGTPYTELRTYE